MERSRATRSESALSSLRDEDKWHNIAEPAGIIAGENEINEREVASTRSIDRHERHDNEIRSDLEEREWERERERPRAVRLLYFSRLAAAAHDAPPAVSIIKFPSLSLSPSSRIPLLLCRSQNKFLLQLKLLPWLTCGSNTHFLSISLSLSLCFGRAVPILHRRVPLLLPPLHPPSVSVLPARGFGVARDRVAIRINEIPAKTAAAIVVHSPACGLLMECLRSRGIYLVQYCTATSVLEFPILIRRARAPAIAHQLCRVSFLIASVFSGGARVRDSRMFYNSGGFDIGMYKHAGSII